MAPYTAEPISSDEEDAPETFSLAQSKRTIKQQDEHLRSFEAAEKEKKKEKNRERDRKLKERSAATKKGSRETEVEQDDEMNVEARMERAMRDAQDEMDELEDGSDIEVFGTGSDDEDEDGDESDEDEDEDEDEEMESVEEGNSEEETEAPPMASKPNPNHIPDHLFTSAFTSQPSSLKNRLGPHISDGAPKKSRKRTSTRTPKDLILGSRAIRTLPATGRPPLAPSALPSRKIQKFLKRTLGLSGDAKAQQRKGWERKAVNIGVMKHNGPASSFVRNR